ncbi:glutamate--cysteine ligase [Gordonibacter sp. An230]|uniref:glutamate-cysteine ligase family protein n=1 Tax=Gordonibacter sp. An230 TaxID=1965592 RepID=UPI000B3744D5|nr:glutamate-cysteine ligase family protein [Gordonibacter sp. An230]OUO87133.1 glutamate--cysteine ligase [Gordonibacter sp. An230]
MNATFSGDTRQPARESNIAAIVSYFEQGIKPAGGPGELGIELEHILVHDDMSPVSYSEKHGVAWLLGQLKEEYPTLTCDAHGDLLGVSRPGEAVTIEPAAQLELSAGPFVDLGRAREVFESFESRVGALLASAGERMLATGYHPTAKARELELIPKRRYQFMDLYLGRKDKHGPCMMRGSASTQVSIDYTSTQDCLRKLRLAFAISPIISLMCDNSPIFEGAPRTHELVRTEIWKHVDDDRCGLVPGVLEPSFDLRRYAEYILDTVSILVPCAKEQWCYSDRTFGDVYADRTMTRAEVEHAVSMFFTDVRLKTYIEIRPADALPIPYAIAYAALVRGLFYDPASLDALDELFSGIRASDYEAAKAALMESGYRAEVYGRPVAELCDAVMDIAMRGLGGDDREHLEPLARLVAARTTLATLAERERDGGAR